MNEHYLNLYRFQDKILKFVHHASSCFYLGGGTALSRFYYNHRYSDDLDFFTTGSTDFIQVVQDLQMQLEGKGCQVSTFGFSQNFARFSISDSNEFPGLELKTDFIHQKKELHLGDFKSTPLFPRVDNPLNILAEKLSYIHKKFPKDIADIWVICRNLSFEWEEIITGAARKRTTDPLFAAEILRDFPASRLEGVAWITPVKLVQFESDREVIIDNIIAKSRNQLVKKILK